MDLLQKEFEEDIGLSKEEFLRISPSFGRYLINQAKRQKEYEKKHPKSPIERLLNRS